MDQIPVFLLLSLPLVGAFAMLSLGIVVIYRASRVLNLAHGAMAMVPAYLSFEMTRRGFPAALALVAGTAAGALLAMAIERSFVRALREQSASAQTVGTVAALGLLVSVAVKIWGTTPKIPAGVFPDGGIGVGSSLLRWGHVGLIGVALAVTAMLFVVFRFTGAGLAMRAAASNPRAASLAGIDPDATTRLAWAIGGALAAVAGILLAAVTVLHPINLTLLVLPAFVAVLIGGLESVPGALAGAAIVGVVQGMVPAIGLVPGVGDFATQVGAPQLVLTVLALVVMVFRGDRLVAATAEPATLGRAPAAAPRRRAGFVRAHPVASALGAVALLGWPFLGAPYSILGDAVQACVFLVIALSLVLLTGWVGQISLAQASFVGIGAFATALLAERAGIPFPLSLPLAGLLSAAAAAVLGAVALRVRGLYLAVATLIFLWMCSEYLFQTSWLVGASGATVDTTPLGRPGAFPFFDFSEPRTFYFVALAVAAAALWGLANLRDSKTGRAFAAVRGSEIAAASLGLDVTRYKLLAFAASGFLAGVAGNLVIVHQGAVSAEDFGFNASLLFLAIATVGGLSSMGGAIGAAILFAGLNELFFRVSFLSGWLDVTSAALLAGVLLAYPGGLGQAPRTLDRLLSRIRPRRDDLQAEAPLVARDEPSPAITAAAAPAITVTSSALTAAIREERPAVLAVDGLTVRFGGLLAVDGVSLRVQEGSITGLIGPNGAGKTTIFNGISGLNVPAAGTVRLFGRDVTGWPVHRRATLGMSRTFQVVQLFGGMTVFDNLLVATHAHDRTGAASHLIVSKPALQSEVAATERVGEVVDLLGLGDVAGRPVDGLPFGVLRMVEVARALVTGAKLILLDEPASGLDNAETDRLTGLLRFVRERLGVSILLIEHDVRMVTSVSDYMYVVERGRLLSEGPPRAVQEDERVVAAYLGAVPAAG